MRKTPKYLRPKARKKNKKMTRNEIRNRFNKEVASVYSQRKPVWLPEYNYVLSLMCEVLKKYMPKKPKVLDLGAGTGNLSRNIFEAFKNSQVTLVDFSENMLSQAPEVLKKYRGQFNTVNGDIFKMPFPLKTFDAVVSSFAIHHARGSGIYGRLYKTIYKALKKHGVFICCDVVEGAAKELTAIDENGWKIYLQRHLSNKEIKRHFSHYKVEDSPISISKHFELLKSAGFKTIDIVWKMYNFAVYAAIK